MFDLEQYMIIAKDTKKEFAYHRHEGKWYWYNRGDEENQQGPFNTFSEALADAIEPYVTCT